MIYLALTLLVLALVGGWAMTLFTLPGNWVMLAALVLFALVPHADEWGVSVMVVVIAGALAVLGELAELLAGALGARKQGGSKRGAVLAVFGSLLGAFVGLFIGTPAGPLGWILGGALGASCGALGGAMLGEAWKGRSLGESWQIGQAAFWGRLLGSVAKLIAASLIVTVTLVAVVHSFFV